MAHVSVVLRQLFYRLDLHSSFLCHEVHTTYILDFPLLSQHLYLVYICAISCMQSWYS